MGFQEISAWRGPSVAGREGAVLAATAFPHWRAGLALLLAVQDVRGRWASGWKALAVVPTIEGPEADPASVGLSDPQLDRAIAVLSGA